MIEALAELSRISGDLLQAGFIIFLRVGAVLALAPGFGERSIPPRIRLSLALAFTLVVFPAVAPELRAGLQEGSIWRWVLVESAIGLSIGAVLRFFLIALMLAGTMMSQASSLSQLFGGSSGEPQPAIGNLLVLGALALAMGLGLHVRFAELLIASYSAMPPGVIPDAALMKGWGLEGVSHSFSLAFSLSAPFVIGGLIYNVALGAINRAMPQLMVAFVGAPALTAGGLILLAIVAPATLMIWHQAFVDFLTSPFELAP